jgi:two-component system sensor histidine kinase PhoQ
MQQITQHQLARAALVGRRALAQPVLLKSLAEKLAGALGKVYASKNLSIELDFEPGLTVRADSGDLYELLGNTLDNAAKWARSRVRLRAARTDATFRLDVEDNGPGFPPDADALLARGARADTRVPGQGLGLSAVVEILGAYEGRIALERSADLGGAQVAMSIPNA